MSKGNQYFRIYLLLSLIFLFLFAFSENDNKSEIKDVNIPYNSLERERVQVVAHRGLSEGYPENTLAAFRYCLDELKVDVIEIDLRCTKDGEIVVIHDATVDRTTDGEGRVADMTLSQLKELKVSSAPDFEGERIPTYRETLELVEGTNMKLLLHIKEPSCAEKMVRLTEEYNKSNDIIIGVESLEDLQTFRQLNPDLHTLGFIRGPYEIEIFIDAGVDIIRLWPGWIRNEPVLVDMIQKTGNPVWTTAGPAGREELKELIELGVDGILTDFPGLLIGILNKK